MTRLEEIEMAVEALPEEEYSQFRQWFLERDWERWDQEIEADSASGKLDFLIGEAREAKRTGKLGNLYLLPEIIGLMPVPTPWSG